MSSGACSLSAAVNASAMLVATGSASSCQNGSVASTQPPRVIDCGGLARSEMVVASLSHRVARAKA